MKTVLKIIGIILILALLAGFITVMIKTDFFRDLGAVELPDLPDLPGTTEDPEPYLEIGGVKYENGMDLADESALRVDVKDLDDYTVNIVPGDVSFDYKVDGVLNKFPYNLNVDWNAAFSLEIGDGYFTFDNENKNMADILGNVYPDQEITDFNLNKQAVYFVIEVVSGETVLELPISGFYSFMDVTLSDEHIVF